MIKAIILDSHPLSILSQRPGLAEPDECRMWLADQLTRGVKVFVPEIIDYELRRELLRTNKVASIGRLDAFIAAEPSRYLPLKTADLRLAAQLWADARRAGRPTADPHALDVDIIMVAQAISLGFASGELVVATSNAAHITPHLAAEIWRNIT